MWYVLFQNFLYTFTYIHMYPEKYLILVYENEGKVLKNFQLG